MAKLILVNPDNMENQVNNQEEDEEELLEVEVSCN